MPQSSWNCGMAEGIPSPESGTLIFEAEMKLERVATLVRHPMGSGKSLSFRTALCWVQSSRVLSCREPWTWS